MSFFHVPFSLFLKLLSGFLLSALLASCPVLASESPNAHALSAPDGTVITPERDLYRDPEAAGKSGTPENALPGTDKKPDAAVPETAAKTEPAAPAAKNSGSQERRLSGISDTAPDYGGSDKAPRGGSSLLEFTMSCFFVIGFIFVLAWLLKKTRLVPNSKNSRLKLISVLPTGPKSKLLLVQVGDEEILVGATPASLSMVYKLPGKVAQEDEKKLAEKSAFFRSLLDKNIGDGGKDEDSPHIAPEQHEEPPRG